MAVWTAQSTRDPIFSNQIWATFICGRPQSERACDPYQNLLWLLRRYRSTETNMMVKGSLCHSKNSSDVLQQKNFQAGVNSYERHSVQGNSRTKSRTHFLLKTNTDICLIIIFILYNLYKQSHIFRWHLTKSLLIKTNKNNNNNLCEYKNVMVLTNPWFHFAGSSSWRSLTWVRTEPRVPCSSCVTWTHACRYQPTPVRWMRNCFCNSRYVRHRLCLWCHLLTIKITLNSAMCLSVPVCFFGGQGVLPEVLI